MIAERERDEIAEWLNELLSEWVQHTSDQEKAERFAGRVQRLFRMSREDKPATGRFSKQTRPVDAVIDLLEEAGEPLAPNTIKEAVLEGGFKAWKRDRDVDVDKCLGAYAPDAKKGRKALRWLGGSSDGKRWTGGLIGLGKWPKEQWPKEFWSEWPDEKFQ